MLYNGTFNAEMKDKFDPFSTFERGPKIDDFAQNDAGSISGNSGLSGPAQLHHRPTRTRQLPPRHRDLGVKFRPFVVFVAGNGRSSRQDWTRGGCVAAGRPLVRLNPKCNSSPSESVFIFKIPLDLKWIFDSDKTKQTSTQKLE